MIQKLTDLAVLNTVTGEIEQYLTTDEVEYLESSYTSACPEGKNRLNDEDRIPSNNLFNMYISETCGTFYFNYFNNIKYSQYEFRFLYLCTFMNYKNYLEYGNSKGENKLMVKNDLFEVLKLSKRETYNTIDYLIENNLIKYDDLGYIIINEDLSKRGKLSKKSIEVVRIFDTYIRKLYEQSLPKEHKKLGLLIKLLPYIHFSLNVVCENPREEKEELIKPYNLTQITKLLGYSTTQRLKKGLMDIKVNGEPVIMISKINNKNMVVVNPKIYYKGGKSSFNAMQGIISMFNIYKQNV